MVNTTMVRVHPSFARWLRLQKEERDVNIIRSTQVLGEMLRGNKIVEVKSKGKRRNLTLNEQIFDVDISEVFRW